MALGVGELAQADLSVSGLDLLGAHHALAAEPLRLDERRLDVLDPDVEGDVAPVAVRALADAAADADPLRAEVLLAAHEAVVHRVVGVDLPAEELAVVALQLLAVLADHLEVRHWCSHYVTPFSAACAARLFARP